MKHIIIAARLFTALLLAQTLMLFSTQSAQTAELQDTSIKVIVVKKGFVATNHPVVLSFAKQIGASRILEQERNPICCIWIGPLEIDKQAAGDHFVMINYGYTLIEITSINGLEMLSRELKNRGYKDKQSLPHGMLTSFKPVKL